MSPPPPDVEFRTLRDEDQGFLWDMLRLAIFQPPGQTQITIDRLKAPPLAAYVQGWMRPDDFGVLANLGDKPAGAAWARFFTETNPGYGYISDDIPELSVAVLPEFRNQGLGSALVVRVIAQAKLLARALSLSVSKENRAQSLYRRLGFHVVERRGDSLVMLNAWDTPGLA